MSVSEKVKSLTGDEDYKASNLSGTRALAKNMFIVLGNQFGVDIAFRYPNKNYLGIRASAGVSPLALTDLEGELKGLKEAGYRFSTEKGRLSLYKKSGFLDRILKRNSDYMPSSEIGSVSVVSFDPAGYLEFSIDFLERDVRVSNLVDKIVHDTLRIKRLVPVQEIY